MGGLMTDREMLLIAYGALKSVDLDVQDITDLMHVHLFEVDEIEMNKDKDYCPIQNKVK